jgi:hypothetical protein
MGLLPAVDDAVLGVPATLSSDHIRRHAQFTLGNMARPISNVSKVKPLESIETTEKYTKFPTAQLGIPSLRISDF